jgi:hypothetical protein
MNFDKSPFFIPRRARKLRTAMSVSLETDKVQRIVSFGTASPWSPPWSVPASRMEYVPKHPPLA